MYIFSILNIISESLRSDDIDLAEKVREGDDGAFGEIVDRYGKLMFNAAVRVLTGAGRAVDSADEITQDALVKAWSSIRHFRGDCSLATWLYKITVNTARDRLRSESRRKDFSLTVPEDDDEMCEWDIPVTSGDTIPEEAVERKETIIAVREAIEALPEDMRKIIVLRELNGMAYSDIAHLLGIEMGTVKSRLNRARAELKEKLLKSDV